MLLHEKLHQHIDKIDYLNPRILKAKLKMDNEPLHIISVYASDITKAREERRMFYEHLQELLDAIPKKEKIIILGDLNVRIDNEAIPQIKQRFNEEDHNDNGDLLIDFCTHNSLRINNTFFDHKTQHKYTFENIQGRRSMIDYTITNREFNPSQIINVRALDTSDIGSCHKIIMCKVRLTPPKKKNQNTRTNEKHNIESLREDSIKQLYINRLEQKIMADNIQEGDDVDTAWHKIKSNIIKAADEAIGKRRISIPPKRMKYTPWFTQEMRNRQEKKGSIQEIQE